MMRLDPNKLAALIALIILAFLAVISGYRLEIGASGLKFESTMHMGQVLHRNSATQKSFRISGLVLVQTS
jgi:hypothetical protein